ncbi:MAG TPA: Npt1/Npt2 family nucleotide transporter [Vicinamibacterales bacterium]|nr:Npt1/Npt2 family nucleotide transporter [Vicinamibacterales bacterium]
MSRLDRIVALRTGEGVTAALMFAYSFLAMTSYNILKPITRSKFIDHLGSDNLPYVQLAAGVCIGLLIHVYIQAITRLPRRWVIPITQTTLAAILLAFWPLFGSDDTWVSVAFYVFGLMLGLLLISQFWTLANDIYDPRQARRIFGFIGAGASLGGATGAAITTFLVERVGIGNLLPVSATILLMCVAVAILVIRRQPPSSAFALAIEEHGVGATEAVQLLRQSRHLQVIALVIAFAAIGAVFVEQQLNMAADANRQSAEEIAKFLAQITVYLSLFGFVVQIGLTSRIHRSFGLVFALLLLPVTLGGTAAVILLSGALWAPGAARVLDSSLRYTIDKTTREVLFLPLPGDIKYRAKPFIDVTVDRFAKAVGAVVLLALIKPWGLGLDWKQISYASLIVMVGWIWFALVARREYLRSFRRSLEAHDLTPFDVRFEVGDAATLDVLVDHLSRPDEGTVLYAIDMLETLGKRNRISSLLLHHGSPRVRARVLNVLAADATSTAPWLPAAQKLLGDPDADVRAAAVRALVAAAGQDEGASRMRRFLADPEPRVAVSAAAELADSGRDADVAAAERTLSRFAADTRHANAAARRDVAAALARVQNPAFGSMLIPLIHDPDVDVAREAIASARAIGVSDALFVPALVSLLGHRELKREAREALIGYGTSIVEALDHFLHDPHEPIWVRRHIPATLARMPSQRAMDVLVGALGDPDGFLRFKIITAIETMRRSNPELTLPAEAIEARLIRETGGYYTYLTLRFNLVTAGHTARQSLFLRALDEKLERALDRIYRLLGLLHSPTDVLAARVAVESADVNTRARGLEYLDNVLQGTVRKRVMPILEDTLMADKVTHANSLLKSRPRDVTDTVAQLIHEHDPVVAAAAVHFAVVARVPGLDDDFDYLLSHRTTDPIVREAAAWARHSRQPAAADAEMPLTIVDLASRLQDVSVFRRVSVDELFRIAGAGRQVRHPRGQHLSRAGVVPDEVLFLIDGYGRLTGDAAHAATVASPAVLNIAELLEERPLRFGLDAETAVVTLSLGGPMFLTMLADNTATAQGLFQMLLANRNVELDWHEVNEPPAPRDGDPLDAVEKTLHLRQIPIFTHASVAQLQELTAVAREVPITTGDVLLGDRREPAIYHLLSGQITIERPGRPPVVAGPGATVGAAEALTNATGGRCIRVTAAGRALRLTHDDLFDVLGDHGELLQGVFGVVLSRHETDLTY